MSKIERKSDFHLGILRELRDHMRINRAPGDSAKGAVAEAKRIVALRFGNPLESVRTIALIESECREGCTRTAHGTAHGSKCKAHLLQIARTEVERKERMCHLHGAPDKYECGVCHPARESYRSRGW